MGIESKIRSYITFEKNWDGDGGIPCTKEAAEECLTFIHKLKVIPSYTGLSGDGEIGLFFRGTSRFIDIGFRGDGNYSFYSRCYNNIEYFGDNLPINEPIPDDVMKALQKWETRN